VLTVFQGPSQSVNRVGLLDRLEAFGQRSIARLLKMRAHRSRQQTLGEFKSIRVERGYRLLIALVIKTDSN
jgi:hypothetical protein